MSRFLIVMVVIATTSVAAAQVRPADYRWHDRFFFGASVGSTADDALVVTPEVSFWGNDYVGVTVGTAIADDHADWGYTVVGAVPLRYVQPYGGAFLGFRNLPDDTRYHAHVVVGMNGFVSRNWRVFVQWDDPPADFLRVGESHLERLSAGLRWSPDVFHSARPTFKIDAVWLPMVLSLGTWGLACATQ